MSYSEKIVIINHDSGYLMIDIANAFTDAGYTVSLITGRLIQRSTALHESVSLDRIVKYARKSTMSKLVTWSIAFIQVLFKLWFKYRKYHLFIVTNPPIAPLLPLLCRNSYSLLFFDLYIEKLEELKFLNAKSFSVRVWKKLHSKAIIKADKLFSITDGMASAIENYSRGKKCKVVPIWTDNKFFKPVLSSENPFIAQHNLRDKFIVLYSGNLGASSGVETLIDVAHEIDNRKIIFVIIGDGIKKASLVKKANDYNLNNCVFLPWQNTSVLPYSLASASLAVVSLSDSASNRSIPSKLYNFFSVGAPVLCIASSNSDLASLVKKYNVGECFNHHEINDIVNFILSLLSDNNQCKSLSLNSVNASRSFTINNVQKFLD